MKKTRLILVFILMMFYLIQSIPAYADSEMSLPAPTGFTVEIMPSHVLINVDGAEKEQYIRIERSTDSGEFRVIGTLSPGKTSYTDYSVTNGHVYKYRARRYTANNSSPYTREIEIIYLRPSYCVISNVYSDQIDLRWDYPELVIPRTIPYETVVERKAEGKSGWTVIYTAPFFQRELRDYGLDPDTMYYYRIRTRYAENQYSQYIPTSSGIYRRTAIPLSTPLTGFALTESRIRLDWDLEALEDYTVYLQRLNNYDEYETIFSTNIANHYIDSDLTPGMSYTYRLFCRTVNGSQSSYSESVTILTETIPAPYDIKVSPAPLGRVTLTWDYAYDTESGFEIWRKEEGSKWQLIDTIPKNNTVWTDYSVLTNTAYCYRVRAIRGEGVFSDFAVSDWVDNADPALPSELIFAHLGSFMLVGSGEPAPAGISYTLECRTGINESWEDYVSGEVGRTLLTFFFPATGKEYDFRLRSENKGNIIYGPIYHLYASIPEAPGELKIISKGSNRVLLSWKDNSEIEDGFRVYRTVNQKRTQIGTIPRDGTTFIDTEAIPGSSVRYDVCAYNAMGESANISINVSIPQKSSFKDLEGFSWCVDAVNALAASGAISYNAEGLFRPEAKITMAEFTTILLKSFDIAPESEFLFSVKDVAPSTWYYPYLMTAVKLGVVIPDQNGYVGALNPVTMSDMAICMNRLLTGINRRLDPISTMYLNRFTDGHLVRDDLKGIISSLAGDGILPPQGGLTLNLDQPVTRAEAAVILHKFSTRYHR